MKLRIAIIDKDNMYALRLQRYFITKFSDKTEVHVFSEVELYLKNTDDFYADVVLVDTKVALDAGKMPLNSVCCYLIDNAGIKEFNGLPAINKYQMIDVLYKEILSVYADHSSTVRIEQKGYDVQTVLFTSMQGGAGVSVAAAAYAMNAAAEGKRVFYFNLEQFGSSEMYFQGNNILTMSDVIYALKSRKGNLELKLESAITSDEKGVDFFKDHNNAYDFLELTDKEVYELISEMSHMGRYNMLVVDLSGNLNDRLIHFLKDEADLIVYVNDGSHTGNKKFERFCEALRVIEQRGDQEILPRVNLLYNRFDTRICRQLKRLPKGVRVLGGIPIIQGGSGRGLAEKIQGMKIF